MLNVVTCTYFAWHPVLTQVRQGLGTPHETSRNVPLMQGIAETVKFAKRSSLRFLLGVLTDHLAFLNVESGCFDVHLECPRSLEPSHQTGVIEAVFPVSGNTEIAITLVTSVTLILRPRLALLLRLCLRCQWNQWRLLQPRPL